MRYCRKCGSKYFAPEILKCPSCREDLREGDSLYSNMISGGFRVSEKTQKIIFISVMAVPLFIALVLTAADSLTGAAASEKCVEAEETYYEEVPYEVETFYSFYPKYMVLNSVLEEQWNNQLGFFHNYTATVRNADTGDYFYMVQFLLDTSNHGRMSSMVRKFVKSGESESFTASFDTDLDEKVDGKFTVYPEPVQKLGKAIRLENKSFVRKVAKCS